VVAPSIACAKRWTQPSVLTADLRGEVGGGYAETVAGIAAAVSLAAGGPAVIDLAAAVAARPDPAGLHVDEAGERTVAILDRLLLRASMAWSIAPAGGLSLAPLAFADPVRTIAAREVEREAAFAPATAVKIGWRRNHRVMAAGDISAAVIAGDVAFDDGQSLEALKPATAGATAGAPAGTTIGGTVRADGSVAGGVPAVELVASLDRIAAIDAAVALVGRAQIDIDTVQRQAARDAFALEQATLRGILEADRARTVMRDAGITVDPATGRVTLHAIDQVSRRTARVEVALDAARTQLTLTASRDFVNERIAIAQLDPAGQAALKEVLSRLTAAEVRLDGDAASIALKADATTVTLLSGRVGTVRQELDALAGTVATKAGATEVDALGTKIGAVEQRLVALGDTAGYGIDIRQARYRADRAAANALEAILANDGLDRRQLAAAAGARQELLTRLVAGEAAQATSTTLLSARIGAAEAVAAQEVLARVEQGKALTQATAALDARLSETLSANVAALNRAIVTGDQATAEAIQQVTARLNGNGVTIEDKVAAIVEATGKITGTRTLAIDANGNLVGVQLVGGSAGPGSLNLINADLRLGTGRVIFNNGSAMQVQGVGFGANRDLIEWFGPTMAVERCSRANGTAWKATDGSAYFGGGLSAGVLYTSTSNPSIQADAVAVLGPYGTNGRKKVVVASYAFSRTARMTSAWSSTGTPSATLALERLVGSGAWAEVQTITAVGQVERTSGYATETEPDFFRESMSGAVTITDTSDPSADRLYRLRLTSRSQATLDGTHTTLDQTVQRLFISSTEE
jgi:hypothetical protein